MAASKKQYRTRGWKTGNCTLITAALRALYPDADCSLKHSGVFELLVATILSAQCTDERVNGITPALFAKYPDARAAAAADIKDLENLIKPAGFYRSKALSIKQASQTIISKFGGKVPDSMPDLLTLRGVAAKTANVVLGTGYGIAAGIVVDTHVKRLSFRLGMSIGRQPPAIPAFHSPDDIIFPSAIITASNVAKGVIFTRKYGAW